MADPIALIIELPPLAVDSKTDPKARPMPKRVLPSPSSLWRSFSSWTASSRPGAEGGLS